uniref:Uncharacterized protein n=1 Tax=Knipowitschia caucasica TaxID=637954 RepID=A0AAV2MKN0_KNICA
MGVLGWGEAWLALRGHQDFMKRSSCFGAVGWRPCKDGCRSVRGRQWFGCCASGSGAFCYGWGLVRELGVRSGSFMEWGFARVSVVHYGRWEGTGVALFVLRGRAGVEGRRYGRVEPRDWVSESVWKGGGEGGDGDGVEREKGALGVVH